MYDYTLQSCCALQEIGGLDVLIKKDAWSKREAEQLNDIQDDEYVTSSIAVVSDADGVKHRKALEKVLKAKGWKYLGSFPTGHGDYLNHLWGSKTFTKRRGTK